MAVIQWDAQGSHTYETGIDHGVLYPFDNSSKSYTNGVAWNGLTGVTESPEGGEPEDLWADNIKYLSLPSTESMGLTITAYTYPKEFYACDGSVSIAEGIVIGQQNRATFGLSYRTYFGNDTEGNKHGYKLHLVYGCTCSPSDKDYSTVNDSPEAVEFSWDVKTTPVPVSGQQPTASVIIDSTLIDADALAAIEEALYGTASAAPYLPLPDKILELITSVTPGPVPGT